MSGHDKTAIRVFPRLLVLPAIDINNIKIEIEFQ